MCVKLCIFDVWLFVLKVMDFVVVCYVYSCVVWVVWVYFVKGLICFFGLFWEIWIICGNFNWIDVVFVLFFIWKLIVVIILFLVVIFGMNGCVLLLI